MGYLLGVDLGTTYTAAAVWRNGRVDVANLGTRAPTVPSVVFLRDDGRFLIGEAAQRRAVTEPERVAREFKRRFGDPTPVIVGGSPQSADALTAVLLAWVVANVSEREGGPPDGAVAKDDFWGKLGALSLLEIQPIKRIRRLKGGRLRRLVRRKKGRR